MRQLFISYTRLFRLSGLIGFSLNPVFGALSLVHIGIYVSPFILFLLLLIGSITIIAAVMLALVQHNYKKLLGYHAVSQVGYMVTGIGLGSPIGIAGGLFHMINHALYKSGLFLTAGAVEKQTKEEELHKVGGLASSMPIKLLSLISPDI